MAGNDLLLQDANLVFTANLPAATASAATSLFDLNNGGVGQFNPQRVEFVLSTPALVNAQIGSSANVAYTVYSTDVATTNVASAVARESITTYGISTNGAATATLVFIPPLSVNRYLFVQATASASTAATSATFSLAARF